MSPGFAEVGDRVVVVDGVLANEADPNALPSPDAAASFLRVVEV